MENLNLITSFLRRIWEVFSIPHPLLGIPFSTIFLGAFAISFSILILRPILGIGHLFVSHSHRRIRKNTKKGSDQE